MTTQTEAQRLAEKLKSYSLRSGYAWHCHKAAAELLRLEADFSQLMQKHNALHINARDGRDRIAELEAEVQALRGAVQPLGDKRKTQLAGAWFPQDGDGDASFRKALALIDDVEMIISTRLLNAAPQPAQGEKK
jgi:hypothetical protein